MAARSASRLPLVRLWRGRRRGDPAVYPGLALYAVHVPLEVADCAILSRSPFQVRSGTCTVELRCFGEKHRRHRALALPTSRPRPWSSVCGKKEKTRAFPRVFSLLSGLLECRPAHHSRSVRISSR